MNWALIQFFLTAKPEVASPKTGSEMASALVNEGL